MLASWIQAFITYRAFSANICECLQYWHYCWYYDQQKNHNVTHSIQVFSCSHLYSLSKYFPNTMNLVLFLDFYTSSIEKMIFVLQCRLNFSLSLLSNVLTEYLVSAVIILSSNQSFVPSSRTIFCLLSVCPHQQ